VQDCGFAASGVWRCNSSCRHALCVEASEHGRRQGLHAQLQLECPSATALSQVACVLAATVVNLGAQTTVSPPARRAGSLLYYCCHSCRVQLQQQEPDPLPVLGASWAEEVAGVAGCLEQLGLGAASEEAYTRVINRCAGEPGHVHGVWEVQLQHLLPCADSQSAGSGLYACMPACNPQQLQMYVLQSCD
jgi:hypothetical protein